MYTSLLRLQLQGWIPLERSTGENNRRVRLNSITKQGAKQLERVKENRERVAGVRQRVLQLDSQE